MGEPNFTKLKAGQWDEDQARHYLQLVQWAVQRLRSIDAESVSEIHVRLEERYGDSYLFTKYEDGDSYLFTKYEDGRSGSLLLEATILAMDKPEIDPQDLVNILMMMRRHPMILTAMAITSQTPSYDYLMLEPQFDSWLNPA